MVTSTSVRKRNYRGRTKWFGPPKKEGEYCEVRIEGETEAAFDDLRLLIEFAQRLNKPLKISV
jgi:hypothetical protein